MCSAVCIDTRVVGGSSEGALGKGRDSEDQ